jgi:hypothetical protein
MHPISDKLYFYLYHLNIIIIFFIRIVFFLNILFFNFWEKRDACGERNSMRKFWKKGNVAGKILENFGGAK